MPIKILFFLKSITLIFVLMTNLYAEELTVIPQKKPILDKITKQQKLTQGIIRPKSKPIKKIEVKKLSEKILIPSSKPDKDSSSNKKEEVKKTIKIVEKKVKENIFLLPKSKPLEVKKTPTIIKTKSKFYSKKDFDIAKKSINAIEKRQWISALSLSKKAKDKSIYNFVQWRHLLTSGNQASFYDYMTFIKRN